MAPLRFMAATLSLEERERARPAHFADVGYEVERTGIEPVTSGLQSRRSPS
jgi:hypothetical protein